MPWALHGTQATQAPCTAVQTPSGKHFQDHLSRFILKRYTTACLGVHDLPQLAGVVAAGTCCPTLQHRMRCRGALPYARAVPCDMHRMQMVHMASSHTAAAAVCALQQKDPSFFRNTTATKNKYGWYPVPCTPNYITICEVNQALFNCPPQPPPAPPPPNVTQCEKRSTHEAHGPLSAFCLLLSCRSACTCPGANRQLHVTAHQLHSRAAAVACLVLILSQPRTMPVERQPVLGMA